MSETMIGKITSMKMGAGGHLIKRAKSNLSDLKSGYKNIGTVIGNNTFAGRMYVHGESFGTAYKNAALNQSVIFAPKDAPNAPYESMEATRVLEAASKVTGLGLYSFIK